MIEKPQLKVEGLAFGHSLQSALKTVVMYSANHPAAEKAMEQTYASVNTLVRQTQQFTFGFLNKRILINELLTDDNTLSHLETEFFKRGIGAISVSAGITLREFKRGLGVIATRPKVIEEKGGIRPFLQQNPVAGMRILPATKPENQDTVLQMSAESYLMAQGILGRGSAGGGQGLELLFRCAGLERPSAFAGSPKEVLDLATRATEAALTNPAADPRESLTALARMLEDLTPGYLLSSLSPEKQFELAGRPPDEVAQNLVEDMTVEWAAKRLAYGRESSAMPAVQEEVIQALMRGLRATQVAERLLQKLARVVEEAGLPPEVFDRIRQEITWMQLSLTEKHAQLTRLRRFNEQEFQRLLGYAREAMNEGRIDEVTEVVEHYLDFLNLPADNAQAEELARLLHLLPVLTGTATFQLMRRIVARLSKELLDDKHLDWDCHQRVADCLLGAAQSAALCEDFETVHKIGLDLESSLARDNARHATCCGRVLESLLTSAAFERVIELYVAKRDDLAWAKTVGSLAKWFGPKGGEIVFQLLEKEKSASNRLRLVRMCAPLLGTAAMEAARRRLSDERWYVVRNACNVLGELGDSEITTRLRDALRHPDVRVQQAAITAIMKSQAPDRGAVFAEALPHLKAQVLETALDELSFLRDPASVDGLQQFLFAKTGSRTGALEKAVRSLAAIASERAVEVLGKVLSDTGQAPFVRNTALVALGYSSPPLARRILAEFVRFAPNDPLATECRRILGSPPA
jgi:HEAT repeats